MQATTAPTRRQRRIYLAGPEVFLPNAQAVGAMKKAACAEAGFEGCFPLDATLNFDGMTKAAQARAIFQACETMMRSCDLLIANCTPFRGVSMDSGTAYEMGFMRALGRPVFGYSNVTATYAERATAFRQRGFEALDCDQDGIEIENFDHAENLMLAVAVEASGGTLLTPTVAGVVDMADLTLFRTCLRTVSA
jgi:nucleoside 2-deoxyribosyltransferase